MEAEAAGSTTSPDSGSARELAPGEVAQMTKDAIKSDPKFAKYARMVSVGVPLGAVRGKMTSDDLTEADIAMFMTAYAPTGTLQGTGRALFTCAVIP
jgi:hypothetical protein